MNSRQFFDKYYPYAQRAGSQLSLPPELILAWWSWESNYATNEASRHNNMAGITYTKYSDERWGTGLYSGYKTLDRFVQEYVRTINLSYYENILASGTLGYDAITRAHNASIWSKADYNVSTIVARAQEFKAMAGGQAPGNSIPVNKADIHQVDGIKGLVLVGGATALLLVALLDS